MTEVYIEVGKQRSVACAWEWAGWCRYGKTPDLALQALADAAPRYERIAARAGVPFMLSAPMEVEQFAGSANTDWAPSLITERDRTPQDARLMERGVALLRAAWASLDDAIATSSRDLRKGPRGGGRDLLEIAHHVVEAERAYGRKIGVKHAAFTHLDQATLAAWRDQIALALRQPSDGAPLAPGGWPAAYATRRFAWHVIDHVWEIEDRQMAE